MFVSPSGSVGSGGLIVEAAENVMANFSITHMGRGPAKGFHMTFANGHTISVQWGEGNYGDEGVTTCEVAAWDRNRHWVDVGNPDDDVIGYQTPDQVLAIMNRIAAL